MSTKITLIGAGSVVFAKNLISDILQFPELSDATLCLMDINPARLKVAKLMTDKMVATLKVRAKVVATLDRREAVKGARYVICTVQVGGFNPGMIIDFDIPRKYGLLQTIADTLGVGGIFRGLRTIPVINAIAQDIADVGAPGCLLLNYTNPMAINCMAVAEGVGIPHVGLCHSVQGTSRQLASYLRLPYEDITYLVAGINHMAFFLKFAYKGQDAYPLLFKLLEKPGFDLDRVRFEMMRRLGYFVTESSTHQSEYTPYFIHHGEKMLEKFEIPIDEYYHGAKRMLKGWKSTERETLGEGNSIKINPQSQEYGAYIIHSCETNTPRVIYGNVPNFNLIDNLPNYACVEVPCLIDAQGVQPTHIGPLPHQVASLCQTNINVQKLTVEAALTGRRDLIYHATMLDPHTSSVLPLDKIWAMCDEMIAAHQKAGLLGPYAPTIRNTGRPWHGTGDRILAEVEFDETAVISAISSANTSNRRHPIKAEIVVTNPREQAVLVNLNLSCAALGDKPDSSIPLKIKVPKNGTVRKKVLFQPPPGMAKGLEVCVTSDSSEVFARSTLLRPRRFLPAGRETATFSLDLAGFLAVEATIRLSGEKILLHYAVDDTKIVAHEFPWEGSVIELFFSSLDSSSEQSRKIRQILVAPKPGRREIKAVDPSLHPVEGVVARIQPARQGGGYEADIEVPFEVAGVSSREKGFLFDTIIGLGALGEAHGGGRISLSGTFDSFGNTARFALVS